MKHKNWFTGTSGTLYLEEVAEHADGLRQVKRLHPGGMHCLLQTVPGRYKDSGTDSPLAAGQCLAGDLCVAIIITTKRSWMNTIARRCGTETGRTFESSRQHTLPDARRGSSASLTMAEGAM